MKRSMATDNNGKFVIIVFACACRVLLEMLFYGGERSFSFKASDWLARAGQCASVLRSMSLKNGFRHVLFNFLLEPLRSTTHVPTITVARKLINNVALM